MENPPFLIAKTSIDGPCSIAMREVLSAEIVVSLSSKHSFTQKKRAPRRSTSKFQCLFFRVVHDGIHDHGFHTKGTLGYPSFRLYNSRSDLSSWLGFWPNFSGRKVAANLICIWAARPPRDINDVPF